MITFCADIRSAKAVSDDAITTSSVGIPIRLQLAPEFDGLAKTLVFRAGSVEADRVLVGDTTESTVPVDVLTEAGQILYVGVYAADAQDGTIVIPTVWSSVGSIKLGTVPSGVDPSDPEPSWVAQVQAAASKAVEDSAEAVETAEDANEIAHGAADTANAAYEAAVSAQDSAQASAQAAAQSARDASDSAYAASENAAAARSSELDAEDAAERAEQAAGTSGYMDIEIDENGHLIYTRTDAVDVDFELDNGHLIMEVT